MTITTHKLNTSLLLCLIYELFMLLFPLSGISITKVIIASFLWISVLLSLSIFFNNFKIIKKKITALPFFILLFYIIVNFVCLIRGFSNLGSISTLLGNPYTGLALFLPILIGYSFKYTYINILIKQLFVLLKIGLILFFIFLFLSGGLFSELQSKVLNNLFLSVLFLITIFSYFNLKQRVIILLSVLCLIYLGYHLESRSMLIRIILLIISVFGLYIEKRFNSRLISKLGFAFMFITLFISYSSITSSKSFFDNILSSSAPSYVNTSDTRTFLYVEVLSDLISENSIVFGKGANGVYYSQYFDETKGDTANRLTVEVGVLAILLKTGLVGLITYLALIIIAIYKAFFISKNNFVKGFGFLLLVYFIVLFFENLVAYSFYNFLVWFSVGLCLSSDIRKLSESDLKKKLKFKNYGINTSTIN